MKRKFIGILMALALVVSLAACGEEEETTLTGMVVSVDGTVISLVEMDMSGLEGGNWAEGRRPEMGEGMEGFEGFGGFDPGSFDGTFPEGETIPQWEGGGMPGGMEPPEDMTMPENGQMPDFGGMGGMNFGNFSADAETKELDIGDAHISVEIDGGKASGTLDDIVPGAFVTITMNSKGQVTYVLVSSQSFPGGNGQRPAN